jgi:hypothetical protein
MILHLRIIVPGPTWTHLRAKVMTEAWCSNLHCVNCSGAHASGNRNCPVYQEKGHSRTVGQGRSFVSECPRKFLETEPKTWTQSSASALHHPQGVDVISQKQFLPRPNTTLLQPIPSPWGIPALKTTVCVYIYYIYMGLHTFWNRCDLMLLSVKRASREQSKVLIG